MGYESPKIGSDWVSSTVRRYRGTCLEQVARRIQEDTEAWGYGGMHHGQGTRTGEWVYDDSHTYDGVS